MYEHRFLENIKKLYKHAGTYEYQEQYKAIIETALVSTPARCTNNSPMTPNPSVYNKKHSARKPLWQFTDTFGVKHKNDVCRFCSAKANHKATKKGNVLWSNVAKCHCHFKNQKFREALYHCNIHHTQVVKYPIENICL